MLADPLWLKENQNDKTFLMNLDAQIWALRGVIFGGAMAILSTMEITGLCVLMAPGDPSAGSVAIVIIAFLPIGIVYGLICGATEARRMRRRDGSGLPSQATDLSTAEWPIKKKAIYVVLGVSLGFLGIHNFCAGKAGKGWKQLLSTILLGWTGIGIVITMFWVVMDLMEATAIRAQNPQNQRSGFEPDSRS